MRKAQSKILRNISLLVVLAFILGFLHEVWKRDQLPPGTQEMVAKLEEISSSHRESVQRMIAASQSPQREKIIQNYLQVSRDWPTEVQIARQFFKTHLAGKTMRVKAKLAGKALQAKSLQTLLEESKGIFENALEGKMDGRFTELMQYDANRAYEKIFPKMHNSQ